MRLMATAPNQDAISVMNGIDAMPKRWRQLAYEFGAVVVRDMHAAGMNYDAAEMQLELIRMKKQAEWLATDFIPKRRRAP